MGRRTRLFLSLYLGFATYCLVVFVFGRTGVVATSELHAYRDKLQTNLSQLESTNTKLVERFDALRSNPETIRLAARTLGFLEPNERTIRVTGHTPAPSSIAVGSLVSERKHTVTSDSVARIAGLIVAIVVFIFTALFRRQRDGPGTR